MEVASWVKEWAAYGYIGTLVIVVWCLYRGQRSGKIDLWDTVRATGKDGKTFTDSRKMFEVGAFVVMTTAFAYWAIIDRLSEAYAAIYVGAFVAARSLRDREQRLNRMLDKAPKGDVP